MNEPLWIVVPAAGKGERMGIDVPKQYIEIDGACMLQHTLSKLLLVPQLAGLVTVLAPDDEQWSAINAGNDDRVHTTEGGPTRADSVLSGLRYVLDKASADTWVLVHDAARPLISIADIQRLTDAVYNSGAIGGILATPVHDTLKRADEYCCIERTVSRKNLWQAQTPQMFRVGDLIEALQSVVHKKGTPALNVTDEASAMESMGHDPLLVEALQPNFKVTRKADLKLAEVLLANTWLGNESPV